MQVDLYNDFRKLWDSEFTHERALHYLGCTLIKEPGREKEGAEILEEAIKSDMPSHVMYGYLIDYYYDIDNFEGVRRLCDRAIEVFTKYNEEFAMYAIERFPDYKDDILEALSTDEYLINDVFKFVPQKIDSFYFLKSRTFQEE